MHSVLLYFHSLITPHFICIDYHLPHFSMCLWLLCRPNQAGSIWCGARIPLLWAVRMLNAIVLLCIGFNVRTVIVFAVSWIMSVPIPVTPILGVRNAGRCAILIAFDWMMVESLDSADIQDLSSSSREDLGRQWWWQCWSLWECKCSRTIRLKEWPGCIDHLFHDRNGSHSGHLVVLSARFYLGRT